MQTLDMQNELQRKYWDVIQCKAALNLAKAGIKARRGVSNRDWLNQATRLTGVNFKARQYDEAIEALTTLKDELLNQATEAAQCSQSMQS